MPSRSAEIDGVRCCGENFYPQPRTRAADDRSGDWQDAPVCSHQSSGRNRARNDIMVRQEKSDDGRPTGYGPGYEFKKLKYIRR